MHFAFFFTFQSGGYEGDLSSDFFAGSCYL